MTLRITLRSPAPTCCHECEFSFPLGPTTQEALEQGISHPTVGLSCCVHDNTHHPHSQPLCPWYLSLSSVQLATTMLREITPWILASEILALPPGSGHEAIVNILTGKVGQELAKPTPKPYPTPDEKEHDTNDVQN